MGLSRMVDHIKPLLRPKSDQQFSHSLGTKQTLRLTASGNFWMPRQRHGGAR